MLKIETGIEPPKKYVDVLNRKRGRPPEHPYAAMAVGESVLVEGDSDTRRKAAKSAHSLSKMDRAAGKAPRIFVTKKVGPNQTRIWRIA